MPTQRQVIISYLTEFGAQKLDAIIWECKVQATQPIADSTVKALVGSLLESGIHLHTDLLHPPAS